MPYEVSSGLVVRDKNLLMVFDDEKEVWNVPTTEGKNGELSSRAAERIVEDLTGCESKDLRYRDRLKTSFSEEDEEIKWQPFSVEIEGETEKGEWVPLSELRSKDLASPLEKIASQLKDRL